jgi:hypothetical protein
MKNGNADGAAVDHDLLHLADDLTPGLEVQRALGLYGQIAELFIDPVRFVPGHGVAVGVGCVGHRQGHRRQRAVRPPGDAHVKVSPSHPSTG